VIFESLSLIVVVTGSLLVVMAPSRPAAGMLLIERRAGKGCEHAADLVRGACEDDVVVCEGGAGDGKPGKREHGEGDVPVPGAVEPDLVMVQAGLVLAGLEALLG